MSSSETPLIRATLPRHTSCGAEARILLSEQLGEELPPNALADLKLVTTELVNNAYLHGTGEIELLVSRSTERIRVEVVDRGHGQTIRINEEPSDAGGRGLRIVDTLAVAWGAFEGTTHVWADLDL